MIKFIWASITLLTVSFQLRAQTKSYKDQWQFPPKDSSMLITESQQLELLASEEEMTWFKDAKLGIFVHWGPALQVTNVLSWGRDGERPGANKAATNGVPPEIYDVQYKTFNPVNFDADEWMQQVKGFGAKYLVFTAKHHDGFCLFDAPNTDYDIMNTPFQRDIAKELADAARRHGVKLFWYYSQPDWTHPDCLRENHYESYLPYMREQVKHLFTAYGQIDGIFWDGIGTKYWQWDTYHVMKELKELNPGMLSNPRGGFGWPDNDTRGDYDTPEQSLGPTNHSRYWEACLTMTDKWLYSPDGPIKTAEGVLGMLIQVAGNGGNLLLNFGPNGEGEFVKEEASEGYRVGEWLKEYGHTIYHTTRGIYIGGDWGASTQKGNKLYLHILQRFADNAQPVIELPALPMRIDIIRGITKGFKGYEVTDDGLKLTFDPTLFSQNLDNIVELTLSENPDEFERIETWPGEPLPKEAFEITTSSFISDKFSPQGIYTNEENVFSEGIRLKSWWGPEKNDKNPWVQLDLNTPKKIKTVLLSENMRSHSVKNFDIETKDENGNWKRVFSGGVIGEGLRIKLSGEEIHGVRLKINESTYLTQITAFNIYE